MSTIKVTNLRHESATSNNIALDSSNNAVVAGTLGCTGDLTITSGNLVVSDGNGINFAADGNLAGMTSELLDDYEEGTWTPSWNATTNSGTWAANGNYTKIGRQVTVEVKQSSGTVSWGAGDYIIGNLPFAPSTGRTGAAGALVNTSPNLFVGILAWSLQRIYATSAGSNQTDILVSITYNTDD